MIGFLFWLGCSSLSAYHQLSGKAPTDHKKMEMFQFQNSAWVYFSGFSPSLPIIHTGISQIPIILRNIWDNIIEESDPEKKEVGHVITVQL